MGKNVVEMLTLIIALFGIMQGHGVEGRKVLDLTKGRSKFLGKVRRHGDWHNTQMSRGNCSSFLHDVQMLTFDKDAFAHNENKELFDCLKKHRLSGDVLPLVIFEGLGDENKISELFGFAPHMEGSLLTVVQKIDKKTIFVDQLLDLDHNLGHGSISAKETLYDKEGNLYNQTERSENLIIEEPKHRLLRDNEEELQEVMDMYFDNLASKIPALGFVEEDTRINQLQAPMTSLAVQEDTIAPTSVVTILYDSEATVSIPQMGKCSHSKTQAPPAQGQNFVRNWLEITLAIDQPANGGAQAIGQFVNVYHKNEVITNMARRPGTNKWHSVGWFVGYNKITHFYDTNQFFTYNYSPENVPMNADVSFDTSFTTTVAASTGNPPTLSYSKSKTEGQSIKYTVSDWEVTKVSESINSNGWYHTNNKPYNGRHYKNQFPPQKISMYNCEITKDGKLYPQNGCNPYWASRLATDDGICSQNILYRTKSNTGYQTRPAKFSYNIETQWSALESWGKSDFFGYKWRACAYFYDYYSGLVSFTVQMNQVQPTLLS